MIHSNVPNVYFQFLTLNSSKHLSKKVFNNRKRIPICDNGIFFCIAFFKAECGLIFQRRMDSPMSICGISLFILPIKMLPYSWHLKVCLFNSWINKLYFPGSMNNKQFSKIIVSTKTQFLDRDLECGIPSLWVFQKLVKLQPYTF